MAAAFRIAHHLGWNIDALNHIRTKAQTDGNRGKGPREDHSWRYWLRLAERLDPSFAT